MPLAPMKTDDFAARLEAALHSANPAPVQPAGPGAKPDVPPTNAAYGLGPVGAGDYLVRPGECMSSIAKDHGHFWETLWNEPGNQALREQRQDPNVLLPGDCVVVPALRPKYETRSTGMRHRFVRRGEPAFLRLTLMDGDRPRANEPFVLEIDGQTFQSTTDSEGKLVAPIPGDAKTGRLLIGPPDDQQEFTVNLGRVDPISELSGVQGRLNNLGFGCGNADGKPGPATRAALSRFQAAHELPVTGEVNELTRAKLLQAHGS